MRNALIAVILFYSLSTQAQELQPIIKGDSIIYSLTVSEIEVNITGRDRKAMTFNGQLPGPTLRFKEGKHAVIRVKNDLMMETSVHWHGLLLPNYMDGVPYLTTPPILPGKTQQYDFPLIQSGTYWYHSHTGFQEQKGVYGSIIVDPIEQTLDYDHDLVILLSDWTDDNPARIMKNLKRHNEWYGIQLGNAPSIVDAIKSGTLSSQFDLWKMKMPAMHISDIPYDAFLANGQQEIEYTDYEPGDKVRVRVINAGASTYFWLQLANKHLKIVAADGLDIEPFHTEKLLIGLAETYDFIVTIEEGKSLEFKATAQDVTGSTSAFLGSDDRVYAPNIPFPDYQQLGKEMAEMHSMDDHDMSMKAEEVGIMTANPDYNPHAHHRMEMMPMENNQNHSLMDHSQMNHNEMDHLQMDKETSQEMDHSDHSMHSMAPLASMNMWNVGYDFSNIRAIESTVIHSADSIRSLIFNLTGNMWRYVWSINGKTLSGSEEIVIKKGEIVRVTLNNTTMMHHPMHLHGHYFRVLNGQGEFSPLMHTVDVPPMSRVTIEFEANEEKDWVFHCHLLYHMMSGMTRVFSYEGSVRDERLAPYPVATMYKHDKMWFTWGDLTAASHFSTVDLVHSNVNSEINALVKYGINQEFEADFDYSYFTGDFFRVYAGLDFEGSTETDFEFEESLGVVGFKYLMWYILDLDFHFDHKLRPQFGLDSHVPITKRLMINSHLETKIGPESKPIFNSDDTFKINSEFEFGFEYLLNERFSLESSYHNHFGFGGGIKWLF